jgi:hypothetical protein
MRLRVAIFSGEEHRVRRAGERRLRSGRRRAASTGFPALLSASARKFTPPFCRNSRGTPVGSRVSTITHSSSGGAVNGAACVDHRHHMTGVGLCNLVVAAISTARS